jgi:tricorn protease
MRRSSPSLLFLLSLLCGALRAPATQLLRFPDLSPLRGSDPGRVVFVYADDLWVASSAGGSARRLTSLVGRKLNARISPDGASVAFTAEAEGNFDIYVAPMPPIPASGKAAPLPPARRLTFHPAFDLVAAWAPDGRSILFTSRRSSFTHPLDKLFTVPREGGAALQLPPTQGGPGTFSPDGGQLAFNRNSSESWHPWRGYRGGRRATISVFDLATRRATTLAPTDANDVFPMWWGGSIFFASDRDGRMNLYEFELAGKVLRQLTHYREADVRHPSLAGGSRPRIVYELGGDLHVLTPATDADETLRITIGEALPERAPRQAAVAPHLTSFDLAPDGSRALVSGRGELFEVAAEGTSVNQTGTSGIREQAAVYSPDGREIAYVSDASGEHEIYVRQARTERSARDESTARGRKVTSAGAGFRQGLRWSPDGKRLLFVDQTQSLNLLDLADVGPVGPDGPGPSAGATRIDSSRNAPIESYDWTPDSAAVVYSKTEDNQLSRLYRYDCARRERTALGDGMTDEASPAVDTSGGRVYFLSARNLRATFSDFEQTFNFNDTVGVYSRSLARPEMVERLPIDAGSLSQLAFSEGRLFYLARDRRTGASALRSFDLSAARAERREVTLLDDVAAYRVSRGVVLAQTGDRLTWVRPGSSAQPDGPAAVAAKPAANAAFDLNRLTMELDPPEEWRQIFLDAWRLERDYFHEPSMNGVDWQAVRRRYEPYLPSVGGREDLNYLLGLMLGELGTSHTWAVGGDMPQYPGPPTGVLGADFEVEQGRYRIERIVRGDSSSAETRSPLAAAEAQAGDFVLAVDGRAVTAGEDLFALLVGKVGQEIDLTLGPTLNLRDQRTVKVKPAGDDMGARYADWVRANRARVARETEGRCGYVHVPNTGRGGMAGFARDFFAQVDKEALIVDIRWNSGGLFPASMIEHLGRVQLGAYSSRHGNDLRVPTAAVYGPKVLLTNGNTGSGGDAFAIYFRAARLGPNVGTRTTGATIGNVGMPLLVDSGEVGAPALAYKPPAGGPQVENAGVAPDLEVEGAVAEGAEEPDPQLARAIAVILGELERR